MPLLVQLLAHPLVVPLARYDTRQAPASTFILDVEPSVFVSCLVGSLMLTGPISLPLVIAETWRERCVISDPARRLVNVEADE